MPQLLSTASVLALLLVVGWYVISWARVQGRIRSALRDALTRLAGLDLEVVATAADHESIQSVLDRGWLDSPGLGRTWSDFANSIVVVDAQPRSTRSAEHYLTPRRLEQWEAQRLRGLLSRGTAPAMPRLLGRMGIVIGLLVLGAALWELPPWEPGADRATVAFWVDHAARSGAWSLLPPAVALALSIGVRVAGEWGAASIEASRIALCNWLDDRYRDVSSEELLARVLQQLERR